MKQILTAEEFYLTSIFTTDGVRRNPEHPFWALNNELTIKTAKLMIEFAKMHVKAALEAAYTTSHLKWKAGETGVLIKEDLELIYPENLIQ